MRAPARPRVGRLALSGAAGGAFRLVGGVDVCLGHRRGQVEAGLGQSHRLHMVVLALGVVAGSLVPLVWGFRSGDLPAVVAGSFGAPVSLLLTALWANSLVDDF